MKNQRKMPKNKQEYLEDLKNDEDARYVRVSRWVRSNPNTDTEECEHCGYNILSEELETPFCPWCGYYMSRQPTAEQIKIEKVWNTFMVTYEWARAAEHIHNPVAYALYQTWKKFDKRR